MVCSQIDTQRNYQSAYTNAGTAYIQYMGVQKYLSSLNDKAKEKYPLAIYTGGTAYTLLVKKNLNFTRHAKFATVNVRADRNTQQLNLTWSF